MKKPNIPSIRRWVEQDINEGKIDINIAQHRVEKGIPLCNIEPFKSYNLSFDDCTIEEMIEELQELKYNVSLHSNINNVRFEEYWDCDGHDIYLICDETVQLSRSEKVDKIVIERFDKRMKEYKAWQKEHAQAQKREAEQKKLQSKLDDAKMLLEQNGFKIEED